MNDMTFIVNLFIVFNLINYDHYHYLDVSVLLSSEDPTALYEQFFKSFNSSTHLAPSFGFFIKQSS